MVNYIKELDTDITIFGLEVIEEEEIKRYIKEVFAKVIRETKETEEDKISTYVLKSSESILPNNEIVYMTIFKNGSMIGYIQFPLCRHGEASFIRLQEEMYTSIVNKIRTLIR